MRNWRYSSFINYLFWVVWFVGFFFYLEQNAGYILKTCFIFIRNFLKMKGKEESRVDWKMETLPHNKQMDSSSCGVLVLKVFNKPLYLIVFIVFN